MWTPTIYKIAGPIYKDMISESGVGSGNMVAITEVYGLESPSADRIRDCLKLE